MILPLDDTFRPIVNRHIKDEWAGPIVVTKGTPHDTSNAAGFISVSDRELTGYTLFNIQGAQCEILVLQSLDENRGIGTALINAVINVAKEKSCGRVCLITTNDNLHAIRYYQRFGFDLIAVHINALDQSRILKPSIPLIGNDGIPLKHEFEFSYTVSK